MAHYLKQKADGTAAFVSAADSSETLILSAPAAPIANTTGGMSMGLMSSTVNSILVALRSYGIVST